MLAMCVLYQKLLQEAKQRETIPSLGMFKEKREKGKEKTKLFENSSVKLILSGEWNSSENKSGSFLQKDIV